MTDRKRTIRITLTPPPCGEGPGVGVEARCARKSLRLDPQQALSRQPLHKRVAGQSPFLIDYARR